MSLFLEQEPELGPEMDTCILDPRGSQLSRGQLDVGSGFKGACVASKRRVQG